MNEEGSSLSLSPWERDTNFTSISLAFCTDGNSCARDVFVPFVDRAEGAEWACKYTQSVLFRSTAYPSGSTPMSTTVTEKKEEEKNKKWLVELLIAVRFGEQYVEAKI